MNNNLELVVSANDHAISDLERVKFFQGATQEVLSRKRMFRIQGTRLPFLDAVIPHIKDAHVITPTYATSMVFGTWEGEKVAIEVYSGSRHADDEDNDRITMFNVWVFGSRKALDFFHGILDGLFKNKHIASIKWWYSGERGPDHRTAYLQPLTTKILPEFYPDIGNPRDYLQRYLQSEESILLMAGPPGTGKTTLLRHLIVDNLLSAHVVYDEHIMKNDIMFQHFLFDDDSDILIVEDADTILGSREREGNKLMSRFLNVSDGLIKLPNKKVVFTTNITDFRRVDEALLRPGRCFGILNTRTLNLAEAQAAAKVGNLPIPTEKREYTLAELFNQKSGTKIRQVGFAG